MDRPWVQLASSGDAERTRFDIAAGAHETAGVGLAPSRTIEHVATLTTLGCSAVQFSTPGRRCARIHRSRRGGDALERRVPRIRITRLRDDFVGAFPNRATIEGLSPRRGLAGARRLKLSADRSPCEGERRLSGISRRPPAQTSEAFLGPPLFNPGLINLPPKRYNGGGI